LLFAYILRNVHVHAPGLADFALLSTVASCQFLISPNVLAACVIFAVISRFTVCLSNTAAVTSIAYCTVAVTALCNGANSEISSHHSLTEREEGNVEENRWEQGNRVSENNITSSKNERKMLRKEEVAAKR
jgi:hypothetical protein